MNWRRGRGGVLAKRSRNSVSDGTTIMKGERGKFARKRQIDGRLEKKAPTKLALLGWFDHQRRGTTRKKKAHLASRRERKKEAFFGGLKRVKGKGAF